LFAEGCVDEAYDTDIFRGYVTGHGNVIPGPSDPDGNELEAVCVDELNFLISEEGEELDRREYVHSSSTAILNTECWA